MALNLAAIRAKLAAQDSGQASGPRKSSQTIPFWNINEGENISLRFLPDGDDTNELFWVERDMINIKFPNIKGGDPKKFAKVVVPCNEMFEGQPLNSCPVLSELREWYKSEDETLKKLAGSYWKKKSYMLQCFVPVNPLEEEALENPIRRVILNSQIFPDVKAILTNLEIDHLPTDYVHGRDFSIAKSKNSGGWAEYKGSFKFNERAHSQEETDSIAKHGLFNLSEFLPKQPTADELVAIKELFEASLNNESYDPARFAHLPWRPMGVERTNSSQTPVVETPVVETPVVETPVVETPVVETPVVETKVVETKVVETKVVETAASLTPAELMAKLKARNA